MNQSPQTLPLPISPVQRHRVVKQKDLPPEQFFALCLREQMKEIRFESYGPSVGHNALWDARYYELPNEEGGE